MPELRVTVALKKAENGRAELDIQCAADIEGFKGVDTFRALKVGDTVTVLIPVATAELEALNRCSHPERTPEENAILNAVIENW